MIDLQKLRYFVTVADTGHVGKAALALHISQSPLSRQLRTLEEDLCLELFSRENRRLTLTPTGRDFLAHARALLSQADQLKTYAHDLASGTIDRLVIGFVEGAVHCGAVQRTLQACAKALPQVKVVLRNLRSAEQIKEILAHELDMGFGYAAPPSSAGFASTRVADEPFRLAVPLGHPLASGKLRADRLDGQPFVALPKNLFGDAWLGLVEACAQCGFTPDIRFEAADPSVALQFVKAGACLAIVQGSLKGASPPGVIFRDLPSAFPLRLQIYRVTPKKPRPTLQRLLLALA